MACCGFSVALLLAALGARADDETEDKAPPASSLRRFIEEVAVNLEGRATEEGVGGSVRLEISGARGIEGKRAEREFGSRLRRRLRDGAVLVPGAQADVRLRLVLSQEGGRVWAVGLFEGGPLPAPSAVAVSVAIDRELEVVLGAGSRPGQSRWVRERLGTAPAGVLDAVLVDIDGDMADDIAILSIDGVRLYRYAPGDSRPELIGGPYALPGERRWPRVAVGWLAVTDGGRLWLATSAGHTALFDPRSRRFSEAPSPGVPVRQPRGRLAEADPLLLLGGRYGTPLLTTPATSVQGDRIDGLMAPPLVRDLLRSPGEEGPWIWVDNDGRLGAHQPGHSPLFLPLPERVGDRFLVVDLDGDGERELVTSAATAPGEGDEVTLYAVEADFENVTVLFRAALSGGSIVALAEGELDFDGNPDVLIVEEGGGREAVLWRLELAP